MLGLRFSLSTASSASHTVALAGLAAKGRAMIEELKGHGVDLDGQEVAM